MNKWDNRFLELAEFIAGWSKDPSTKVGAVITHGNRIVSLGFNGPPQRVNDAVVNESRDLKLLTTIHAEENAILFGGDVKNCTIYVTHPPCANCAAKIIQAGIMRVVYRKPDDDFLERWMHHIQVAQGMYQDALIRHEGL